MKLGFIGTGNLASAIIRGVVASGFIAPENIFIYDVFAPKMQELSKELSVSAAASANDVVKNCDGFVMAVKPKDAASLLKSVSEDMKAKNSFIISTAAGTEIGTIASSLGFDAKIIRIMPNINAAVSESMTALCANENVPQDEKAFAMKLCSCFGKAIELEEKYFAVFSAVACCAPAYAYMFADALKTAGVKYGLTVADARKAAAQMLMGSAKMLLESDKSIGALIDNVCSPAGTTIEGVCALKECGFENAVITAIDKAVEKDNKMASNK
ncbi:MAG: pyrroline-5-carboxylate reductase [Clostridia bacterium]|nr:pyrroline-5-carboxylate reductase [Clostridia bacterium]